MQPRFPNRVTLRIMTDETVFTNAQRYDRGMAFMERWGLRRLRREVWRGVSGRVLEIGAGTGANYPYHGSEARVTAFDIEAEGLRWLRAKYGPADLDLSRNDAQHLPFAAGTFDAAVGTLTFCSIPDPHQALAEIGRVLRPGGRLILLEHVRGQHQPMRLLTDLLQPFWFALQGSCHLNRETAAIVRESGFHIDTLSTHAWGIVQLIRATR